MSTPVKMQVIDERGHIHLYTDEVIAALTIVGTIWREGNVYRCLSTLDLFNWPDLARCDFCNAQPVTWDVDAESFKTPIMTSVGGWAACEACGRYINTNQREQLEARSLAFVGRDHSGPADDPGHLPIYLSNQRQFLKAFWMHFKSIKRMPHVEEQSDGQALPG